MAFIRSIHGKQAVIGNRCFLAENASLIGDVVMGDDCSIWFNTVVRADVNAVRIGDRVNIQDGAVIHCTYKKAATHIGSDVSIGHNAIVHGCRIDDRVLVGMGAIVMDNAHVSSDVIIAAGSVVLQHAKLESGYIYGGVPARKLKPIDPEQREFFIERTARNYIEYASWFDDEE